MAVQISPSDEVEGHPQQQLSPHHHPPRQLAAQPHLLLHRSRRDVGQWMSSLVIKLWMNGVKIIVKMASVPHLIANVSINKFLFAGLKREMYVLISVARKYAHVTSGHSCHGPTGPLHRCSCIKPRTELALCYQRRWFWLKIDCVMTIYTVYIFKSFSDLCLREAKKSITSCSLSLLSPISFSHSDNALHKWMYYIFICAFTSMGYLQQYRYGRDSIYDLK